MEGRQGGKLRGQPGSASRVMEANRCGPNVYDPSFLTNTAAEKSHGLWDS